MNLFGILFGFIFSIFPLIILARIFKGKFLFISNPYMKGALMGFILSREFTGYSGNMYSFKNVNLAVN